MKLSQNSDVHLICVNRHITATQSVFMYLFVSWDGEEPNPLIQRPNGQLYQHSMLMAGDECEAVGGVIVRGKRIALRKPAQMPLCARQIPHDLTRDRTQSAALGSRRLIA
jgi:hypothetical protein